MNKIIKAHYSSFTYLNIVQSLCALNVNTYKFLVIFFFIEHDGIQKSPQILSTIGTIYVVPFLLFSAFFGTLADRYSKNSLIVVANAIELILMVLGCLALVLESRWGTRTVLFLLATQYAFLWPSKYGIIPELVEYNKISQANALMASLNFLAIITGTFCASFLLQITQRSYLIASLCCILIAAIGLYASFGIKKTIPSGSKKSFKIFFFIDIYQILKHSMQTPSLLPTILGTAYFLFAGSFIQLNIIPFTVQSLGLPDLYGSYLFLLSAVGIAIGALIAGKLSKNSVELGLVPIGVFGMALFFLGLYVFSAHLYTIIFIVILLGLFAGIFEIPLLSYIQAASPPNMRGQMIAAGNFLGFFGILCTAGLIYINSEIFHLNPSQGFIVVGLLTGLVSIFYTIHFFERLNRLLFSFFKFVKMLCNPTKKQ